MRADSEMLEAENTAASRAGKGEKVVLKTSRVRAQLRAQLRHVEAVLCSDSVCGAFHRQGVSNSSMGCFGCPMQRHPNHVCVSVSPIRARGNFTGSSLNADRLTSYHGEA